MVFVETSFPRGAIAKPIDGTPESTEPDIEFGATTFKRKKEKLNRKQRDEKHIQDNEEKEQKVEAVSAELLSIKTLNEGMIVMGCVKKIDSTYLMIALPGRINGKVLVTSISKSYVNIVNKYVNDVDENVQGYKTLDEMFNLGQIVCVKVMQIERNAEHKLSINLSMNPIDIQAEFQHNRIPKDTILVGAIQGVEDHGYTIDTGITNLRAFIPSEKATPDLGVGEIIFCSVIKSQPSSAASTVICSMSSASERQLNVANDPNLSYVLPTSIVKFKVTNILTDGIQGTVLNDTFTAYINEHQLQTPTKQPKDYDVDDVLDARVLYVMPLTKLVYLSLNLREAITEENTDSKIKIGDVIEQAKIMRIGTGGLILKLNEHSKGLITFKSLRIGYNSNFDMDELLAKYHKNSFHTVRITGYDPMDSLFVCSNNAQIVKEKFFTIDDLDIADYVDATIRFKLDDGGYAIKVGHIYGYIEKIQISATTPVSKLVDGAKLRCRVLRKNKKENKIFLTNRKELMPEDALLLRSHEKACIGLEYQGMVAKIYPDGYLISFCDYVKGMLYKRNLSEEDLNITNYFYVGQITTFLIMYTSDNDQITLGLKGFVSQTGTTLKGRVSSHAPNGLNISFTNSKLTAFVPSMFLTNFSSLASVIHQTYKPNEQIDAVCVAQNLYSIREVERVRSVPVKDWHSIKVGDIVPAFVKDVADQIIDLTLLIENYIGVVKCHAKMMLEDYTKVSQINLVAEQLLYVRVLGKNKLKKTLTISAKLSHVWDGDLLETTVQFRKYFKDLQHIQTYFLKEKHPLASLQIGTTITAKINKVCNASKTMNVTLPHRVNGIISTKLAKKLFKVGDTVECIILWVDYSKQLVHLTATPTYLERHAKNNNLQKSPKLLLMSSRGIKADVLLITEDFIILYPRKLTHKFIFVPTRFHYNDLQPIVMNDLHEGKLCNVTPLECDGDYIIGMFENVCHELDKLKQARKEAREKLALVKKMPSINLLDIIKEENEYIQANESIDEDITEGLFYMDTKGSPENTIFNKTSLKAAKRKSEKEPEKKKKKSKFAIDQLDGASDCVKSNKKSRKRKPTNGKQGGSILPGASNFWKIDVSKLQKKNEQSSSSEEEENPNVPLHNFMTKKAKLTTAERFRMGRNEETRVRTIEEANANENGDPTTIDQFERSVMATPDSSLTWINYMVFYMQSNEVHRARAVARRAFKKISFREQEELLNVWCALLNLELRYGDKDTFDVVLREALQVNEPFKVYSKCLLMLASVQKIEELSDMVLTFTKKFRQQSDCWSTAAMAYFEVGLVDKAQPLLNRALTSLPERDHVSTIVKFASLNNKYGNQDRAHALMEQILTSYPKRVDCWSQYIDMLVKEKQYDNARQVLERAVIQKIPMKKMRTIFKKYLDFEEKYGNEENIQKVKQMASNYVEKELKV